MILVIKPLYLQKRIKVLAHCFAMTILLFPLTERSMAQNILEFPVNDISEMLRNGTVEVKHSQLDIGSINDVFDYNNTSLARSANINPLVITLTFPFPVRFSGSRILQTYGDGWWTLEAADTEYDLTYQTGSYQQFFTMSSLLDGIADEITFNEVAKKIIRLTVSRTTGDDYVHLNEWQLVNATAEVEIVTVCTWPSELHLLPSTHLEVELFGNDAEGLAYPISTDVSWSSAPNVIFSYEASGPSAIVTSKNIIGTRYLRAEWKNLSYELPVHGVADFKPKKAETRVVNVALVIIDPPVPTAQGKRFHEIFHWEDPQVLANLLADSLNETSEGVVDYRIISTYDEPTLYAQLEGTFVTITNMYHLLLEPGWETLHALEQSGDIAFDYNGLLAAHDFCASSNTHQIDEVWVYSMPFTGMYESRLTGEGAFWYNSPPLDSNDCIDQLPIMGFNYERGLAEAMHSFGHRVESAMTHTFGRWNYDAEEKNDWEKFTSYDKVTPGQAHIGNIHFPLNARYDYDYSWFFPVESYEENWYRYPFLFDKHQLVGCKQWNFYELGYMSFWFRRLPNSTCKNRDGILNNWWTYIVDYNEGKALERHTSDCGCEYVSTITASEQPEKFNFRLYPNPASDQLWIETGHDDVLTLEILNMTGIKMKEIQILPGKQTTEVDLRDFPPGIYSISCENSASPFRSLSFTVIR